MEISTTRKCLGRLLHHLIKINGKNVRRKRKDLKIKSESGKRREKKLKISN
jgi:hypothetical protein